MKKIKLKTQQINFLNQNLKDEALKNKFSRGKENKSGMIDTETEIVFSDEDIEKTLDELTYLLTSVGFDENGNINALGGQIEDIIDLFSNQMYK